MGGHNGVWRVGLALAVISFVAATACSPDSIDLGDNPSTLSAFDSQTGALLWATEVPAYGRAGLERLVIARLDGKLLLATRDPVGMVAVDAADGLPTWQFSTGWDRLVGWRVDDDDVVLLVADHPGRVDSQRQPQLMHLDPVDGAMVSAKAYLGRVNSGAFDVLMFPWPTNTIIETVGQVDIRARCHPVVPGPPSPDPLCDLDSDPEIWLEGISTATGELLWQQPVEHEYRSLASASKVLYAAVAPDSVADHGSFAVGHSPLVAIDVDTGSELWRRSFPAGRLYAKLSDDVLYVIHTATW